MRVLVTGAAGYIGKKLIDYLLVSSDPIEYIVAVDREDIPPGFINDPDKQWVQKNLDEANTDWWNNIITSNEINRVYYLESFENQNKIIPEAEINRQVVYADNIFADYTAELSNTTNQLEVCYLSTDRIYLYDTFPHELNKVALSSPSNDAHDPVQEQYASIKYQVESRLLHTPGINPRALRIFALTDGERNQDCPLYQLMQQIANNEDIQIYQDGKQGIVYTYTNDLIDFMVNPNLFSSEIEPLLYSKIINFCSVWNYLPVDLLVPKLINKMDSSSHIISDGDNNIFENLVKTPQIMNMVMVTKPNTPIEIILEEIQYTIDPTNTYAPLVVTGVTWEVGMLPTLHGTVEPNSVVTVYFDDGYTYTEDSDSLGSWSVPRDLYYDINSEIMIKATSPDYIQYMTVLYEMVAPDPAI